MKYATFKMDRGDIKFRLYEETPIQVRRFVDNANQGLFKEIKFYRVESNYLIQSGPNQRPDGLAHGLMWDELKMPRRSKNNNFHAFGVLSACNAGREHSSVGAFFISLGRWRGKNLDQKYTTFGHVIEGMHLIEQIEKDEVVHNIIITES
jgi:cyclophilin family peptidyl-prolyl cis-trans isomerase